MFISLRRILLICAVIAGVAYGITILRGFRGIGSFDEKRKQIMQLERENEMLHREIEAKQNYINNLQQNPDQLKLEIERRLKLMTPGTKQFILQDGITGDSTTPDAERRR